jgi:hypothetical protein
MRSFKQRNKYLVLEDIIKGHSQRIIITGLDRGFTIFSGTSGEFHVNSLDEITFEKLNPPNNAIDIYTDLPF